MMATAELAVLMTLREAYSDGSLRFKSQNLQAQTLRLQLSQPTPPPPHSS